MYFEIQGYVAKAKLQVEISSSIHLHYSGITATETIALGHNLSLTTQKKKKKKNTRLPACFFFFFFFGCLKKNFF